MVLLIMLTGRICCLRDCSNPGLQRRAARIHVLQDQNFSAEAGRNLSSNVAFDFAVGPGHPHGDRTAPLAIQQPQGVPAGCRG